MPAREANERDWHGARAQGRTAALLVAGVLAVHELRYVAGYGEPGG